MKNVIMGNRSGGIRARARARARTARTRIIFSSGLVHIKTPVDNGSLSAVFEHEHEHAGVAV